MRSPSRLLGTFLLVAPALISASIATSLAASMAGCSSSGDDTSNGLGADSGVVVDDSGAPLADSGSKPDSTPSDSGLDSAEPPHDSLADTAPASTKFKVRIENVSGASAAPTPISPGVWALHSASDPLFSEGKKDRGEGLERIAEDGNPSALAAALASNSTIASSGVYDTPVGATAKGPALPDGAFELEITATPAAGKLSFASMFGQSNDVFIAPSGAGIDLFDASGKPLPSREVTASVGLWDVGSEHDQPPRMGPDQAPRQPAPDTGAAEGVVDKFTSGTRGLPIGRGVVDVSVTASGSTFTIKITNVSTRKGAIVTPISPVFYATHDATFSLFKVGTTAKGDGLESLAEDGSPAKLVAQYTGKSSVGMIGAAMRADGASADGPAPPDGSFTITVTPDNTHPRFSFGAMVGQSNDAFVALHSNGVALLDAAGAPRPATDVRDEILASVAVWDAGTEANEVPGVGKNQAPRQAAPNTGADDPIDGVRLYDDAKNDLAAAGLSGFVGVTIVAGATAGTFDVTVANVSGESVFPGVIGPVAWATHDAGYSYFSIGKPSSMALERIAEDGMTAPLDAQNGASSSVMQHGIANMSEGGATGPITAGHSFHFTVTPDAAHRFLSLAAMWVPSNDTFIGFDPSGIALLDASGAVRTNAALAADVASHFWAWDAGTELNQAGAIGPDQAPRQAAPNTGEGEGPGVVRAIDTDKVWSYPSAPAVVKVTITPM